jgi:hypothetical protein
MLNAHEIGLFKASKHLFPKVNDTKPIMQNLPEFLIIPQGSNCVISGKKNCNIIFY